MKAKGRILVVDDNPGIRNALKLLLPPHFEAVEMLPSPATLVSALERMQPHVVLLDMNFTADINTGNEGLYWTRQIRQLAPQTEVVLFTAYADIALAVEGMRSGAFDFIVKPWDNEKLLSTLSAARDKAMKVAAKPATAGPQMFWGTSGRMAIIHRNVQKIAPTDATVLITGENGTGKDVLAREIHRLSLRRGMPLVAVDAGALTETLFESELFGHVKGAFTDAHADHPGKFEQASGGTLFLDEIGNIPLHLQAKLLRVLQNREVVRVGDTKARAVDIRLICATNQDLERLVAEGRFREDLYYRINTVHLRLPALRERPEDIAPLAGLFAGRFSEKYHRPVTGLSPEALSALEAAPWSGNIRELQNAVEKAVILSEGTQLTAGDFGDLSPHAPLGRNGQEGAIPGAAGKSLTLDEAEERAIREALDTCGGNLTQVARTLGISRPTLYAKLKKYGL